MRKRGLQLLFGVYLVALLIERHPEMIAVGRVIRRAGNVVAEDLERVVRQILLQINPPQRIGDLDLLRQCVRLSLDVAGHNRHAEGQAVYRAMLRGLVGGWGLQRL